MKILIRKFKTIDDFTLEIPSQISGGNGIGKSTILEAISFVLSGKDLNGNEFKQVYDNRVDLHDAIADVSFFDNYGNEFQRIVKPIFQTSRSGIEEIKIKRSTECRKNGITCNDFAPEFSDFFKFGTDYFFLQKEDVQRGIFIDLLKSKMPNYDIKEAVAKKKMLENAEKNENVELKKLQIEIKDKKDVAVPKISAELEAKNKKYLTLRESDNSDAIEAVNKRNNKSQKYYFAKKSALLIGKADAESNIKSQKLEIEEYLKKLKEVEESKFEHYKPEPTDDLISKIEDAKTKLDSIIFYETINEYAAANFNKNPILVENRAKLEAIKSETFEYSGDKENDQNCPISGAPCETSRLNAVKSAKISFDNSIFAKINEIKEENRKILQKELSEKQTEYFNAKSALSSLQARLQIIESENEAKKRVDEKFAPEFEKEKIDKIKSLSWHIESKKEILKLTEESLELILKSVESLKEPELEKLPESINISEELKAAHSDYLEAQELIVGAKAINSNNAKEKAEKEQKIKKIQSNLFEIVADITTLKSEISEYFSNLKGVISEEFKGDIIIDVELLEFVMSSGEYKDCFKVTANGKVFPYECNGALQNNTKLQILANMQRLIGYNGVTVIDNCEANTTQPINTLNLNCVTAFATNEEFLTIK